MNANIKMVARLATLWRKLEVPIHSRLRAEGSLGEGAMAKVEAVFDNALMRHIASKTIHASWLENSHVVNEFVREVQITAALDHPFIIPVYDLGFNEQGQLFFTMKKFKGTNLENHISDLPPGRLVRRELLMLLEVVVKVCDALAFAHDRGVIHCDLKPEHIIMARFGQVFLIDWGVAHITAEAGPELRSLLDHPDEDEEEEAVVKGTIQYMSPEQAKGDWDRVNAQSDIFSVGAILYELLARVPPYIAPTVYEGLDMAMKGDYSPLAEETEPGSVPPELETIVMKAMAINPAERYASASELGDALRAFMGGGGEFPTIRFEPGAKILSYGEQADCAYIIKSGRCEAFREVDGERVSLEVMEEGTVFGELALLTDQIRSAGVVALEEGAIVQRIKAADFEAELQHMRPWVHDIFEKLAERVRKHDADE